MSMWKWTKIQELLRSGLTWILTNTKSIQIIATVQKTTTIWISQAECRRSQGYRGFLCPQNWTPAPWIFSREKPVWGDSNSPISGKERKKKISALFRDEKGRPLTEKLS